MRQPLTLEEFNTEIFSAQRYAWRWEQQQTYLVEREQGQVAAFLAGHPIPPTDNPSMVAYLNRVHRMVRIEGRQLGRVRIIDEPATGYQRWLQWIDGWARAAGEDIHYLSRPVLQQMGRPPVEPDDDWWLIDGERLLVLRFEASRLIQLELVIDEPEIRLARLWRLAVISWAREEESTAAPAAAA